MPEIIRTVPRRVSLPILGKLLFFGSFLMFLLSVGHVGYFYSFGPGAPHPTIACDQVELEIGPVRSTDVIRRVFFIRNDGRRPLLVKDVKPGCGACVQVTSFTTEPILPGQSGLVCVKLFGESVKSPQVKGVSVYSNDPQHPQFSLRLAARPMNAEEK